MRFREGMASGATHPKVVVERMVGQLDAILHASPTASPFYQPVGRFPEGVPAAEQARLRGAYAAVIQGEIFPAYRRLRQFLVAEYLPAARDSIGISQLRNGADLYRFHIQQQTTTNMSAEEIHQLGLSEVARFRRQMEAVKEEIEFDGSLRQFIDHVRTDPRLKARSKEELRQRYEAVQRTVDLNLPRLFERIPKAALVIRPEPEFRERSAPPGHYESAPPDGSAPATFYFNAYDLPNRNTVSLEAIYLHEASPGHHLQTSLAQENAALPSFQRFGTGQSAVAYGEGWSLYAESLGDRLGLYTDPYQRFGALGLGIYRAARLVVDTGIHARGWTREQAVEYLLNNSTLGEGDVNAEIDRYIALPAQALSYKIGELTISRLRQRAERRIPQFDIRAFHTVVLESGSLPLAVLEAKVERWILAKGRMADGAQ
jgi:uncharacterized protein (DUF885 family)